MSIYIYKIDPSNPDNYLRLVKDYDWQRIVTSNHDQLTLIVRVGLWIGTRQRGLVCYSLDNGEMKLVRQLTVKGWAYREFCQVCIL